ncbi:MAG TPA: hypothetical protein VFA81_04250 [Burkholderiales bacterium]|nr:hypothetical protein [Burkholderiales bacterium]
MKTSFVSLFACALALTAAGCASNGSTTTTSNDSTTSARAAGAATRLEQVKPWEVGDKFTYNWVVSGKPRKVVSEIVAADGATIMSKESTAGRSYDVLLSAQDMSYAKGVCLANGQACEFSPALVWVSLPLEPGKTWSGSTTVTGETFIADVSYERTVDKVETVKTAAGQFEAYKVISKGRIKSTDKNGANPSTGEERSTMWLATVNGKLVPVKIEYKNSYGERFSRELALAEVK